ncbi:MAG: hypothetical protein WAU17_09715, partial [Nitrospirales bacterium]
TKPAEIGVEIHLKKRLRYLALGVYRLEVRFRWGMGVLREGKRGVANIIRCPVFAEIGEMNRKEDWNQELRS